MNKSVTINGRTYYSGRVYIYDREKADNNLCFYAPEVYNDPTWFDKSTGNFHIVPKNTDYIKFVAKARTDIKTSLKNSGKVKLRKNNEPKPRLSAQAGWGARDEYRNIEKCVQLEKNGYKYQLNFERMYVHNNNVNCMFGLFQFYKHPFAEKGINMNDGNFLMAYPASCEDSKSKPEKTDTHVVYNPELPSLFELWEDGNLEKVCEAFLSFVRMDEN